MDLLVIIQLIACEKLFFVIIYVDESIFKWMKLSLKLPVFLIYKQ